MKYEKSIFIALDGMPKSMMLNLVKKVQDSQYYHMVAGWKIHDAWDRYGPEIIRILKKAGAKNIWLDIKLHDTPRTVMLRSNAAAKAGVDMISIHASSGVRSLKEAVKSKIKVAAITALTSLDEQEIKGIYGTSPQKQVARLASIANKAKVFAIVCSKHEIKKVLEKSKNSKVIVPGIKMSNRKDSNQKRVGTPKEIFEIGASYIVIGKEITKSKNPLIAFENIAQSLL